MTVLKVENPIITSTNNVKVLVQCLTDELKPVTGGRMACILNTNKLLDILEVKDGKVEFNIKLPEQENEYALRFTYSGSIQSDEKAISTVILYNKSHEQKIDAKLIVEDYYCKRGEEVEFKSYIQVPDGIEVKGKAVLKLDGRSIAHAEIIDNKATFNFVIPAMILDDHTLFWKYGTDKGVFINSSILYLEPRVGVESKEYHPNKGVSDEIRQILKQSDDTGENDSKKSLGEKIRKLF